MIIDAFLFFNEFDMLLKRMKYLNDKVDYFVIVECNYTFSGKEKPLNYLENKDLFNQFNSKIIHLPYVIEKNNYNFDKEIHTLDYSTDHWRLETEQRCSISKAVECFDDEDIILISDVDEIPNKAIFESFETLLNQKPCYGLSQDFLYYNLTNLAYHKWGAPIVLKKKILKNHTPHYLRSQSHNMDKILNAGWHLSYFMPPEKIAEKIESFSHQEYNKEKYKNLSKIKEYISTGKDLFNRDQNMFHKIDLSSYPKDFLEIFGDYA